VVSHTKKENEFFDRESKREQEREGETEKERERMNQTVRE